jgi:ATP-dependent Clp protease ATP-binding subunit ClpC
LREGYEKYHNVHISDEVLKSAVDFSSRYISDRFFPDKAIDIIDEASSRAKLNSVKKSKKFIVDVTEEDVTSVVSNWTGIPVAKMNKEENARLIDLEKTLKNRVVGQDEAVKTLAETIRSGRVGLRDPKRTIGCFLFAGSTGVGKTECAKALAEALFDDEDSLIRLDMSEYAERYSLSRLIGSAPGYVDSEKGGQLTESVRKKPYSVVLFDEIEKAHPDLLNILLQITEDGFLTDSKGRRINFRNTVIILTSNIGSELLMDKKAVGFNSDSEEVTVKEITKELKKYLRPELINRLDKIVLFKKLSQTDLSQITVKLLKNFSSRAEKLGVTLRWNPDVTEYLALCKDTEQFGARPLRRRISDEIETLITNELLQSAPCKELSLALKDNCITLEKELANA